VAASRSATGGALMANDPHLGVNQPNAWLIAGMKSPGFHMVGLMIPGVPFVALGRNERIAWGGTNMRAWSSDLCDVSGLPAEAVSSRTERLRVRWWPSVEVSVRDTPAGPIISDAPPVSARGTIALSWIGHSPSDELTAMLRANRAGDFAAFREAFAGWSVSGQNFLYADVDGNIGQLMAVRLPLRDPGPTADPVRPLADRTAWRRTVGPLDLPYVLNPAEGFLASANNKPAETPIPVSFFFSDDDRIERMQAVLSSTEAVTPVLLRDLQRDTYMASSHRLANVFSGRLSLAGAADPVADALAGWDGRYDPDSVGALAFELVATGFVEAFLSTDERGALEGSGRLYHLLADAVKAADPARLDTALAAGLAGAREPFARFGTWGAMHRMVLRHPIGQAPLLGRRFVFADFPVGGSSATLMKTAHRPTTERHDTRFGSQSRHVSDLADPDANWFLLLGGQDGWFNSVNFLDQVPLWRDGAMIRVPLTPSAFAAGAVRHLELTR
jgi:penicillin amidase